MTTSWPDDLRRDRLIGDWYFYQRKGGHRTSTDDLITAWYACHRSQSRPEHYLDLGSGIGSVLLMVTRTLAPPHAHGLEAQQQSVAMARRAIAELPPHPSHIEVIEGDFRTSAPPELRYELITGSPPYFPIGTGVLPSDPQRLACRFETRGGVEDYVEAASRLLSPNGRLYIVFPTVGDARVQRSSEEAKLRISGRAEFLMREERDAPFLTVYEMRWQASGPLHRFQCAVRDRKGEITREYQELREELGVS